MKKSTFHLHWVSFIVSFFFGTLAFLFYLLFARVDRRDKIYSSLFGWFLSAGLWLLLLRFTNIKSMLPPELFQ